MYDENETMKLIGKQTILQSLNDKQKSMIIDIASADGMDRVKAIADGFVLGYLIGEGRRINGCKPKE